MSILVTGGAGYIGSHTMVQLINNGYDVVAVDNLCNSSKIAIDRVEKITGKQIKFYEMDLLDDENLDKIFKENKIESVIHFAGLKAVGESVSIPIKYYHNNITSTLNLCQAMRAHNVKKLVFSSSATVYGNPKTVPITEDSPLSCNNPYGRSKLFIEEILADIYHSDHEWDIAILRYFNPVGAHKSGLIGEDPNGIPNNLVPYISQVAIQKLECLSVFGDDYDTPDGTGVRDYIHVEDLAFGHLKAIEKIQKKTGVVHYNLGTGKGYSVFEMIKAFEKASNRNIKYKVCGRRPGDIGECYADTQKAFVELGFKAEHTLEEMCADTWRWQQQNPNGYTV